MGIIVAGGLSSDHAFPSAGRFGADAELARIELTVGQTFEQNIRLPAVRAAASAGTFFVPGRRSSFMPDLRGWSVSTACVVSAFETHMEDAAGGTLIYGDTSKTGAELYLTTSDALVIPEQNGKSPSLHSKRPMRMTIYGKSEGRLQVESSVPEVGLPACAVATFRDCGEKRVFSIPVEVPPDGRMVIPATPDCRTLILRASGFGAIALPVHFTLLRTESLGKFVFRPAAEVAVRVVRSPSGAPVSEAEVRVVAGLAPENNVTILEAKADNVGRLALTDLPAGQDLTIEAREPGTKAIGHVNVRFDPGEHARIDPLEILEPATLIVEPRISQRVRDRYPKAALRAIVLQPKEQSDDRNRSDSLDQRGAVTFLDLSPGKWTVRAVVDAEGTAQPIDVGEIELQPGETLRLQPVVEPVLFEGRLVGVEPGSRWTVAIADPPSKVALRRRIHTDSDLRFTAILPHAGVYDVSVRELREDAEEIRVGGISFVDSSVPVEVRVPAAVAVVRVRDNAEPVGGAAITGTLTRFSHGTMQEQLRHATTDASGIARFNALAAGQWTFRASPGEGVSRVAEKSITISSDRTVEIVLDLSGGRALTGWVRDAAGMGVGDARVDCLIGTLAPTLLGTNTTPDGQFSIDLMPEASNRTLLCSATAASGVVGAYAVASQSAVVFPLPAQGATLVVPNWGQEFHRHDLWLVATDGRVVSLSSIASRIGQPWSPLRIPVFPTGSWRLIRANSLEDLSVLAGSSAWRPLEIAKELRLESGLVYEISIPRRFNGSEPSP